MQNITTNALQAMPEGGDFHIAVDNYEKTGEDGLPLANGSYAKITLTDEGQGIPAAQMDKIFDPFYTTKAMGSGLGLAICYSIVKKHEGFIAVRSKKDSGTSFEIYLPASPEKVLAETVRQHGGDLTKGEGRILVMDDNENVREVASAMLSLAGYKVEVASDGLEAIEYYQNALSAGQPYALVILDLTVPGGMGGRETIETLREIDPQVKAIVSSGYSNDKVMIDYHSYGFKYAVTKPYTLENFNSAVQSVLGHTA
jgi:CheY-like chemotaxis protein